MSKNSLGAKKNLKVAGKDFEIFDIAKYSPAGGLGVNPDGSLQLWTHEDGSDSMFMALLRKSSDSLN